MTDLDLPPVPCHQEFTVMSADAPEGLQIGCKVYTYEGTRLLTPEGVVIPEDQEIQVGQQVICWGCLSTVETPTSARSISGHTTWFLKRGGDDRNSWVCWGGATPGALTKLQLSSDPPRGQPENVIMMDDFQEVLP
jgi:hypothetical protein